MTHRRKARSEAVPAGGGRPRITLIAPGASPQEAAAIVAALERYVADTARPPSARPGPSRWLRAALAEGIGRGGDRRRGGAGGGAWGDPHP